MANTLLTPDVLARQSLVTLHENTVMLPLVYKDLSREFEGTAIGETVNVRRPATFTAKVFDPVTGIEIQNATETSVPVVLDKIADVSFEVTSKDLTLHILDFDEQFLNPALEAIAQHIDRALLGLRSDVTAVAGTTPAGFEWNKPEVLIEAGRLMDIAKIPTANRYAVTGPTTKAQWLNSDIVKHADKSGSTEALRRGSIGRDLFGFEAFQTQNVGQAAVTPAVGQPTTEVGVAFHPNAFCFVSAPLEIAPGSNASVMTYKGVSIRVAYDYDIKFKKTVVSLDTLYGVKTLEKERAVLLKGADKA
ncbi:P22 phage major capsid protein family protein [Rhodococcus erythropolis]|uniref:P22 phage major capsid protein family protein n=1 Tax=Rhodococcus erythropolis TaxID=1833 RepID=UPI0024BAABA3|nr:P22 phage major capsid protein family protein [Rhodococcus erythropolis]MDJ0404028.1 P22 phage major capsid protein family protein [Rhodococcus erythropolis]